MTTAAAQKAQAADVAGQMIHAMRVMNVSPIPRNYQLFYEAYIGTNPALTRELSLLGNRPRQEELDELAATFIGTGQASMMEKAHGRLGKSSMRCSASCAGNRPRSKATIVCWMKLPRPSTRRTISPQTCCATPYLS